MTSPPRKGRNPAARAVFAAHEKSIVEAIGRGVMMKQLYQELTFPGSYQQFHRYCQKALGKPKAERSPAASAGPPPLEMAPPPQMHLVAATQPQTPRDGPRRPVQRTTPPPPWDPANIDKDRLTGRTKP